MNIRRLSVKAVAVSVVTSRFIACSLNAAEDVSKGPPTVQYGVASGDVTHDAAIVWNRCDRPAQMSVEYAETADFQRPRRAGPVTATADSDFTAKVELTNHRPGELVGSLDIGAARRDDVSRRTAGIGTVEWT